MEHTLPRLRSTSPTPVAPAPPPIKGTDKPLLAIDVWEHACYIGYRSQRQKFMETFLANFANGESAARNLS